MRSSPIRYGVTAVILLAGLLISIRFSDRGLLFESRANDALATTQGEEDGYSLQALNILNRVLLALPDQYVEPERIDPHRMLVYALDRVQNEIPEVVTLFNGELDAHPSSVEVQVGAERRTFDLTGVVSQWEMSFKLREIFRFMQAHLDASEIDLQDVEYTAINGLLSTLDPHSVLLSPEIYEDMQASNRGTFGGLGIVISIRDGQLTIMSAMDDTPAAAAGLRTGDRIVKINDESTVNMPLDEAVSRLRGNPGTEVTIEVFRNGWTEPHKYTLTRQIIDIQSVRSQALGDGIGYVEIRNFQGNTHSMLIEQLAALDTELGGMRGLVLDLRNNPGGLLSQAVDVVDTFLDQGTIVTTVGRGDRLREESIANPGNTQPTYPIVVLVNTGSASASEIVAGALKNQNRAIIVGDTTFGKGTVQTLTPFEDGSALKLTIAQYLTPGGISIQGVGIVPDISILPVMITDTMVDLYASTDITREGDLEAALTSSHVRTEAEVPTAVVIYYDEPEQVDPNEIQDPDAFESDFQIEFARQILQATGETWERSAMLGLSAPVVEEVSNGQLREVIERLRTRNVDWSSGENVAQPVDVELDLDRPHDTVEAGETVELTVRVRNRGNRSLYRVRAITESRYPLLSDREFVFGRIDPGESRTWSVSIDVPIEDPDRYETVIVRAFADQIDLQTSDEGAITVTGRPRPHWGFSWRIDDAETGNGDGLLQEGETVRFIMDVTNNGAGDAGETMVYIRNESEAALFLRTGREEVDSVPAGGNHRATFEFSVGTRNEDSTVTIEADVYDTVFRELLSEQLVLPVGPGDNAPAATPLAGRAVVSVVEAPVRSGASPLTPVLAVAQEGTVLAVDRVLEPDWVHVTWELGDGWIERGHAAVSGDRATSTGTPRPALQYQAPIIDLDSEDVRVSDDSFVVRAAISDDQLVRDWYISVFNWVDADSTESTKRAYGFVDAPTADVAQEISLRPGMNRITLVARDTNGMTSSGTIYVFRDE